MDKNIQGQHSALEDAKERVSYLITILSKHSKWTPFSAIESRRISQDTTLFFGDFPRIGQRRDSDVNELRIRKTRERE